MRALLFTLFAAIVGFTPASAIAQLVPKPETEEFSFCPSRPGEPLVISNMDVKEAHKSILLQRMYLALSFHTIVSTGVCSCENRFPSWEPIVEYYLENYAHLEDRHEVYAATDTYDESIRTNRIRAREICVARGHWN